MRPIVEITHKSCAPFGMRGLICIRFFWFSGFSRGYRWLDLYCNWSSGLQTCCRDFVFEAVQVRTRGFVSITSFPFLFLRVLKHSIACIRLTAICLPLWRHFIMGIYLSTPKTEKFSEDGENGHLKYGLSSMQGWRSSMEDAVISWFYYTWALALLLGIMQWIDNPFWDLDAQSAPLPWALLLLYCFWWLIKGTCIYGSFFLSLSSQKFFWRQNLARV